MPLFTNKKLLFDLYKSSLSVYLSRDLFIKYLEIFTGTRGGKKATSK